MRQIPSLRFNVRLSLSVSRLKQQVFCLVAAAAVLALVGCSNSGTAATPVTPVVPVQPVLPVGGYPGAAFTVRVQSGSAAVVGASVQLYVAGTTGNGSAATALLSPAPTTSSAGTVSIAAGYSCPSASSSVYLVASGGSIGGAGTSNSGLALLSAIGPCSSIASAAAVTINEVTTVAGMYALLPFYNGGQIGASATNQVGLANAFLSASDLANVATGSATGTTLAANGVSAAARINSAANALNACVVRSSQCGALNGLSTSLPGSTLEAVANLVRFPGKNPAGVFAQAQLSTAFSPALSSAPGDWTMFVTYSGGGLDSTLR